MDSLNTLPTAKLEEAIALSEQNNLSDDFIDLLKQELAGRELTV